MLEIPEIVVINRSSIWTDAQAAAAVIALQTQVTRDFAPIWHIDADLKLMAADAVMPSGAWWLALLDNSDDASALGYHDLTPDGAPLGKVFLKTTTIDGSDPHVTVSHELLEMLVDPYINTCVMSAENTTIYAYECCDACEDDQFGYDINGLKVSDFVTPAWFEGWRPGGSAQFDFGHHITAPFELIAGGYIGYMRVTGGGWQQATADRAPHAQYRSQLGGRRERRALAKHFWRTSTAHTSEGA